MKYDLNQYLKVTVESVDPRNFREEFETEDTLTQNNNNNNNYNMHISKFSITMQDTKGCQSIPETLWKSAEQRI